MRGRRGDLRRQERGAPAEQRGERRLADPSEAEAGHRDAELRGGDVAVRIGDRAADRVRAPMAFSDELVDARLADRHDREFGGDEEPVGEDQRQEPDQAPDDAGQRELHHISIGKSVSSIPGWRELKRSRNHPVERVTGSTGHRAVGN